MEQENVHLRSPNFDARKALFVSLKTVRKNAQYAFSRLVVARIMGPHRRMMVNYIKSGHAETLSEVNTNWCNQGVRYLAKIGVSQSAK
jgi:hypothetical protein